jgi:hypothetical protein
MYQFLFFFDNATSHIHSIYAEGALRIAKMSFNKREGSSTCKTEDEDEGEIQRESFVTHYQSPASLCSTYSFGRSAGKKALPAGKGLCQCLIDYY